MSIDVKPDSRRVKCMWCNNISPRYDMIKHKNMKFYHKEDCYQNYIIDDTMKFINKRRSCPLYTTIDEFTEKHLEKIIIDNLENIEVGMKVVSKQFQVENGIIDILAIDNNNVHCIIELKIVHDCKDLVFQCAYYPTQFNEKVRMIAICPYYSKKIRLALSNVSNVEVMQYYFIGYDDKLVIQNFNTSK